MKDPINPHGWKTMCSTLPLADVQTPSCHDPQRDAENHQHGPWVRRHQRFPHKAGVEVDLNNPEGGYACVIILAGGGLLSQTI